MQCDIQDCIVTNKKVHYYCALVSFVKIVLFLVIHNLLFFSHFLSGGFKVFSALHA